MAPAVIIIAKSEHAPALRKQLGTDHAVSVFPESESLHALEAIAARPPKMVALDPAFVATARGATLVAHMKADPHLRGVDLRVLLQDEMTRPLLLTHEVISEAAVRTASQALVERCGTRAAVRVLINGDVEIVVNGERSELVNLSVTGAQVVVPTRLRPEQRLRLTLVDDEAATRVGGVVAWSAAEPTGASVRYRAGIAFIDPDPETLEGFCLRHGVPPERAAAIAGRRADGSSSLTSGRGASTSD